MKACFHHHHSLSMKGNRVGLNYNKMNGFFLIRSIIHQNFHYREHLTCKNRFPHLVTSNNRILIKIRFQIMMNCFLEETQIILKWIKLQTLSITFSNRTVLMKIWFAMKKTFNSLRKNSIFQDFLLCKIYHTQQYKNSHSKYT